MSLDKPFLLTRKFTIYLPDGDMKTVVQLHTEEWPDLTAPKEPRCKNAKGFLLIVTGVDSLF